MAEQVEGWVMVTVDNFVKDENCLRKLFVFMISIANMPPQRIKHTNDQVETTYYFLDTNQEKIMNNSSIILSICLKAIKRGQKAVFWYLWWLASQVHKCADEINLLSHAVF